MNCAIISTCRPPDGRKSPTIWHDSDGMTDSVAIIGAGHAGVQAAASLREEGFEGRVMLISGEPDLPYHKPPLSKTFVKDATAHPQPLRGEAFYAGNRIDLALGETVERFDLVGRSITFAGGERLAFGKLILATGARARPLPLPGVDLAGVAMLRTLDDARLIRDMAKDADQVVVIGAGFIGLEIAATLAAGGKAITVIEAMERPLSRGVAAVIAAHVRQRMEANGIRILTHARIEALNGEAGRVRAVKLASGVSIPADLVIIGVGVVPNVEIAASEGLDVANGIRVDPAMRTTAPDVLAVGDCVSYRHWMTGQDVRLESVQNATDQARVAARTIMGHEGGYASVPWFWSDIGDMKLQMVGLIGREDRHVVVGSPEDNKFSVFHFAGDRLTAIETVNRPADHMLGRRILATAFSPSPEALKANPDGLKAAFVEWQAKQPA
jgi:3-phenylpropionate/trans-cinnamate dioxygenase ferredoxin reductase subunit